MTLLLGMLDVGGGSSASLGMTSGPGSETERRSPDAFADALDILGK